VKASGADSVYFGGFSTAGGTFVQQLRKALPAVTVLAGDRVFTDTFIQAAGKNAAEGVYITCPCVPPSQARGNFADQFANRFKDAPGYYAPEAYDAANVLLAGLAAGKGTRADLLAWVNGYDGDGISRHVKFTPKGDLDGAHPQVWAYRVNAGDVKKEAVIPDA